MPDLNLSICTVLYKSEDLTRQFHRELMASLAEHTSVEVLYHDNSPTDALHTMLDQHPGPASYTADSRNLGFSYGNNVLIRKAKFDRILLLNPDVLGFTPAFWPALLVRPSKAVYFARLLNADGSFQDCVGDTVSLWRAARPTKNFSDVRRLTPVGMGIMAFMLASQSVFRQVGMLDEAYPLYGEDMDWCFRARKLGVDLLYDPSLELTHVGGASAADRWSRVSAMDKKYAAERIFIGKHFRGLHRSAMLMLNRLKVARMHARAKASSAT
jgi:GT2 family glycosyltransferase